MGLAFSEVTGGWADRHAPSRSRGCGQAVVTWSSPISETNHKRRISHSNLEDSPRRRLSGTLTGHLTPPSFGSEEDEQVHRIPIQNHNLKTGSYNYSQYRSLFLETLRVFTQTLITYQGLPSLSSLCWSRKTEATDKDTI